MNTKSTNDKREKKRKIGGGGYWGCVEKRCGVAERMKA